MTAKFFWKKFKRDSQNKIKTLHWKKLICILHMTVVRPQITDEERVDDAEAYFVERNWITPDYPFIYPKCPTLYPVPIIQERNLIENFMGKILTSIYFYHYCLKVNKSTFVVLQ